MQVELRDGRKLAYDELGSESGTPIVHCHGTPSSSAEARLIFDPRTLAELDVRLIVPDRPGVGRSDFQPGRRIVDWPNDVEDLARALGLDRFAILGSSGGGPYALACGAVLRDRVRTVGVLGSIAPLDAPGLRAAIAGPLRVMLRLARSAPPVARGLLRLNLRAMRAPGTRERMARSFPEPDRSLLLRPEIGDGFMNCLVDACREGPRGAVCDLASIAGAWGFDLASIRAPVLLWHGELDRNVPVAHGRYLERAIPGCRATFYPGDAHLSTLVNHHREVLAALAAPGHTRA